jgi:hypothetical protein
MWILMLMLMAIRRISRVAGAVGWCVTSVLCRIWECRDAVWYVLAEGHRGRKGYQSMSTMEEGCELDCCCSSVQPSCKMTIGALPSQASKEPNVGRITYSRTAATVPRGTWECTRWQVPSPRGWKRG